MKTPLLTLFALLCITNVFAQKTELTIGINSGLFSYSGASTQESTFLNHGGSHTYTNSIYGSKNGLSYGLSLNLKHISEKSNFIIGVDAGVERLRSKVAITDIWTSGSGLKAEGTSYLNTDFLNFYPNLGRRFNLSGLALDLTGGFDFGFVMKAQEKGKATDQNNIEYSTEVNRKNVKTDLRPRIQLGIHHNLIGAYVGYAYGLQNYTKGMIGGPTGANSRLIRFGLTYQIK